MALKGGIFNGIIMTKAINSSCPYHVSSRAVNDGAFTGIAI
jgi:hypothetical protein